MAKTSDVDASQNFTVTANSFRVDENDPNLVMFDSPLIAIDQTTMRNGARYDIDSLDISKYRGKLFALHDLETRLDAALARVINLHKNSQGQLVFDGLKFYKHGYAQLARDLFVEEGAIDEFSIGTKGPQADKFGTFYNHELVEFSLVHVGNNYNTHANSLLEVAVQNGIDLNKYKLEQNMAETETPVTEPKEEVVETPVVEEPKTEEVVETPKTEETTPAPEATETTATEPVEATPAPTELPEVEIEKTVSTNSAQPEATELKPKVADFTNTIEETQTMKTTETVAENSFADLSPAARMLEAIKLERNGQIKSDEYSQLNAVNKDTYKNALGDDELGGLIAPAELIPEPTKATKNYQEFLNAFRFREGRLHYSLNNLYSNVRFVVAGCGVPATQSGADINNLIVTQETLRTYTPVCNKNIEFSEVDIANLFENEYQTAFDRALVEYAIGQFEVAVETRVAGYTLSTGTAIPADTSASIAYPAGTVSGAERADALGTWVDSVKESSDGAVVVMTKASVRRVLRDLAENGVADTSGVLNLGDKAMLESILDTEIVLVPAGTLPTVGSGGTVTIAREGAADITVNHAMFVVSPDNFLGLYAPMSFDVSSEAAYEVEEETDPGVFVTKVRSPKLYDETVLWGKMHRGGGVRDLRFVAGVQA